MTTHRHRFLLSVFLIFYFVLLPLSSWPAVCLGDESSLMYLEPVKNTTNSTSSHSSSNFFVSTLDGKFFAIHAKTGLEQWAFDFGPVLDGSSYSTFPQQLFVADPRDGTIYAYKRRLDKFVKVSKSIREITAESPFSTEDGNIYTGSKIDKVFVLDSKSGELRKIMLPSETQFFGKTTPQDYSPLLIGRTEFTVMVRNKIDDSVQWNVSYASFSSPQSDIREEEFPEEFHFYTTEASTVLNYRLPNTPIKLINFSSPIVGVYISDHHQSLRRIPVEHYVSSSIAQHPGSNTMISVHRMNHGVLYATESHYRPDIISALPFQNQQPLISSDCNCKPGSHDCECDTAHTSPEIGLPLPDSQGALSVSRIPHSMPPKNPNALTEYAPLCLLTDRGVCIEGIHVIPDTKARQRRVRKPKDDQSTTTTTTSSATGFGGLSNGGKQRPPRRFPFGPGQRGSDASTTKPPQSAGESNDLEYDFFYEVARRQTPVKHPHRAEPWTVAIIPYIIAALIAGIVYLLFLLRQLRQSSFTIDGSAPNDSLAQGRVREPSLSSGKKTSSSSGEKKSTSGSFESKRKVKGRHSDNADNSKDKLTRSISESLPDDTNNEVFESGSEFEEADEDDEVYDSATSLQQMLSKEEIRMRTIDRKPKKIGKLEIQGSVIGHGSFGTVVYKGKFEDQEVAIKRVLVEFCDLASGEVDLLRKSDRHPNVVRYYCLEQDAQFYYIALELCMATLVQVVEGPNVSTRGTHHGATLDPEKLARLDKKLLARDLLSGIEHLHSLNIVHMDVKPQNVLISSQYRAMISDLGLCKTLGETQSSFVSESRGTIGWIAPEFLTQGRKTKSVDIFSSGCVLHYLFYGSHPFGVYYEREVNIRLGKKTNLREGHPVHDHLIADMIAHSPDFRPDVGGCLSHPSFWSHSKQLEFLMAISDLIEKDEGSPIVAAIEKGSWSVAGSDWRYYLEDAIVNDLFKFRKYRFDSVVDLLRAFRNKKHHYKEWSAEIKSIFGDIPDGYMSYINSRFPLLLIHMYRVASKWCRQESTLKQFFE